jgi:hypothetical protein
MDDLQYETASELVDTWYYLQPGRKLHDRKCFDCERLLVDQVSNKKIKLHWCSNSILQHPDKDDAWRCSFIICPPCHELRMKAIQDEQGKGKRRSYRN